jgi:hypothetical protein
MPESPTAGAILGVDSTWQCTTKSDEELNGAIKTIFRCSFCKGIFGFATATGIEEHLSGLRLRNGKLGKVRSAHTVVSSELKNVTAIKKEQVFRSKQDKKTAAKVFLQKSAPLNYENSKAMPQQKLPEMVSNGKASKDRVDSALCECTCDGNLPASLVDSTTFRKFYQTLRAHGPVGYVPVDRHTIFGKRLQDRAACARDRRQKLHSSMEHHGFTCGSDGARMNKHPLVNFVMFNVSFGNINWTTKDCSEHLSKGGVKDTEIIADMMLDQAQNELTMMYRSCSPGCCWFWTGRPTACRRRQSLEAPLCARVCLCDSGRFYTELALKTELFFFLRTGSDFHHPFFHPHSQA